MPLDAAKFPAHAAVFALLQIEGVNNPVTDGFKDHQVIVFIYPEQ